MSGKRPHTSLSVPTHRPEQGGHPPWEAGRHSRGHGDEGQGGEGPSRSARRRWGAAGSPGPRTSRFPPRDVAPAATLTRGPALDDVARGGRPAGVPLTPLQGQLGGGLGDRHVSRGPRGACGRRRGGGRVGACSPWAGGSPSHAACTEVGLTGSQRRRAPRVRCGPPAPRHGPARPSPPPSVTTFRAQTVSVGSCSS